MNENKTFIKLFWSYVMVIMIPVMVLGFVTTGILLTDTGKLNILSFGSLAGNARYITLFFLVLVLAVALMSIAVAYIQVKKMKRVILAVFNDRKGLEDSLSEQLESAKERILSNLLHNVRPKELTCETLLGKCGIVFLQKYFAVMTISDTQSDDGEIYSSAQENVWSRLNATVKSLLNEMGMSCEAVRTGSNSYSFVVNCSEYGFAQKLRALPEKIMSGYNIFITAGVGEEMDSLERLYVSYENSVSSLRFALNERFGEAVLYSDIKHFENEKIYYTVEKEKQLIRSIKIGSVNMLTQLLDEIYCVNFKERHIPHHMLKRLIFSVSLTVYKALDEVYENDMGKHEKYARVCQNLFRNDNHEECFSILREICISVCEDVGRKSGEDEVKGRIVEYVAKNYIDSSLSLEALAEHMDISYHYLSRIFKEYLGTNFVSYLTLVRLEKAKELLIGTDDTIETVAKKTGFVGSNSLIRAFKKYYDITPGKYRRS